jgi:hypothetical protein
VYAGRDAALRALRNATTKSSANRTVEKIAAAHIELASPGLDAYASQAGKGRQARGGNSAVPSNRLTPRSAAKH